MALSRTARLTIVISMVVVFCVLAPLLIFYARGYRYDFKAKEVHQVGMVMVAHDPITARSTLDGNSPSFDITAFGYERFTDLAAGTYHAKVERDGWHSWEKDLEVWAEMVTWARYVTLFRQDAELKDLVSLDKIAALDFSPNREWVAVAGQLDGNKKVLFYSLNNDKIVKEISLASLWPKNTGTISSEKIIFGPDSTQALLILANAAGEKRHVIISRATDTTAITLEDAQPKLQIVNWHPDTPTLLYGTTGEKDLYRLSVNAGRVTPRKLASQVLAFQPAPSGLYVIRPRAEQVRPEPQSTLTRLELDGSSPEIITEDIELADGYDLAISAKKKIAVRTGTGALYTVTPDQTERVALDVAKINWGVDNDQEDSTDELLLYSNNHEIYTYDPSINNSEAITRYAENIDNAIWYNGNYKYIIFTVGGKVKIIELDERDHRNVIDFWQASPDEIITPQSLFIDNDSQHIFLTTAWQEKMAVKDLTIRK